MASKDNRFDLFKATLENLRDLRKGALKGSPDELRSWFDSLGQDFTQVARRIPASTAYLSPGDLIMFRYLGSEHSDIFRIALVSINNTGNISYQSTQGNLLLTCFLLPYSEEVSRIIIQRFYKNKNRSYYVKVRPILVKLFGSHQYRSFNLNKMTEIYKINLNMEMFNGSE